MTAGRNENWWALVDVGATIVVVRGRSLDWM
jgi:hypothetical protein